MDAAVRQLVWDRAGSRCEYCHLHQEYSFFPFEIDHIIAVKHHGLTTPENLALSCYYCNTYKGPCVAGWSEDQQDVVRLFNPRRDEWAQHFRWNGPVLVGETEIGRVTIHVLRMNHPDAVEVRRHLLQYGESLS